MKVRPISEALRKKAEEELNETDRNIEVNLKILKNWFKEHFDEEKIQPLDQWLIAFLRGCKYDVEKSQKKLEKYYKLIKTVPDFVIPRNPFDQNIQELLKLGLLLPLKKCAREDSPRTCLVRMNQLCGSGFGVADLMRIGLMKLEILLLEDDNCTIVGEEIITDMKNVGFSILRQYTPNMVRKIMTCALSALSVRLKIIHVVNAPRGIQAVVALFKMFMPAKLRERIYIYGENYEGLYDHVPKSILPAEYGGTNGNIQDLTDYWKSKAESYSDWYAEYEKTCNEFKKSKKTANSTPVPNNNEQRSLRSLNID